MRAIIRFLGGFSPRQMPTTIPGLVRRRPRAIQNSHEEGIGTSYFN